MAPARLTLAFHPPPASITFTVIKTFAEAVTQEAAETIDIALCSDAALGGALTTQLDLVDRGAADAAFVIPGFTPQRFPDNFVFGIPGLFRDVTEASLVFSRLVHARKLAGYSDHVVIGAFCTEPFTLHAKKKLTTLADFQGMKLRAANNADEIMLKQLGADARVVPGDQIVTAIESGAIDGTTLHAGPLFDLGISRVTRFDYFLRLGCAPLTVLMNRESFARLPQKGQEAILRHSGECFAAAYAKRVAAHNETLLVTMRADPTRIVTEPTQAEIEAADAAFKPIVDAWLAADQRNRQVLDAVKEAIATYRASSTISTP
jgi:TRAP-type C4-dicarboxylate transport system substrate-binding protein